MRKTRALILAACCLVLFSGCAGTKQAGTVRKIVFDRGNGSVWGDQFYIELCPEEITTVRYFPAGSSEYVTREHIPIDSKIWEEALSSVRILEEKLEPDTPGFFQKLFGSQKQDGGDYRKLTVYRTEADGVTYKLPADPAAQALEAFLENLV